MALIQHNVAGGSHASRQEAAPQVQRSTQLGRVHPTGGGANSVAFSPSGLLACAGGAGVVVWSSDLAKNTLLRTGSGACAAEFADVAGACRLGVACARGGEVWDVATAAAVDTFGKSPLNAVAPHPNGFYFAGDDGAIHLRDLRCASVPLMPGVGAFCVPITSLAVVPSVQRAYAGFVDGMIRVFDLRNWSAAFAIAAHDDAVCGLSVSQDGDVALSQGSESVKLWNAASFSESGDRQLGGLVLPQPLTSRPRHCAIFGELCVSSEGNESVVRLAPDLVRETFRVRHPGTVTAQAVSRNGEYLATCCDRGFVQISAL